LSTDLETLKHLDSWELLTALSAISADRTFYDQALLSIYAGTLKAHEHVTQSPVYERQGPRLVDPTRSLREQVKSRFVGARTDTTYYVRPVDFLEWARSKSLPIPAAFASLVPTDLTSLEKAVLEYVRKHPGKTPKQIGQGISKTGAGAPDSIRNHTLPTLLTKGLLRRDKGHYFLS